mmetsp:Transcript_31297/g.43548  ORF Transcript_31297/g.43548 Transcript_31297/m.43548 type:complete len:121 (-) Transcript_31297:894-1256(-)
MSNFFCLDHLWVTANMITTMVTVPVKNMRLKSDLTLLRCKEREERWRKRKEWEIVRNNKNLVNSPYKNPFLMVSYDSKSKVPEAVTLVKKMSTPYAKTSDVDSRKEWALASPRTLHSVRL